MLEILERILPELEGVEIALIGSLNLYIQGITEVAPSDIDFLTDNDNLQRIADKFQTEITRDEDWGYKQTTYTLDYVEIHFGSYEGNALREGTFPNFKINIQINGLQIPCMSLESELNFYSKGARDKDKAKAELIKNKLNSNQAKL